LQGELAGLSPERAAKRGRTLLNLRCEDVEGGLLGRSLLTLVNNKVGVALMMCRRNVVAECTVCLSPARVLVVASVPC